MLSSNLQESTTAAQGRTIPFDYTFRFELTGRPNTILKQSLTVSIEGNFVAVSIGYGVIPTVSPVVLRSDSLQVGALRVASLRSSIAFALPNTVLQRGRNATFAEVLRNGIRLNPAVADVALAAVESGNNLQRSVADRLLQVVSPPPKDVQFLYALYDEGTGREFQNEPILNTAGLGAADGNRPFRRFPKPIEFSARTTVRMEVMEVSDFRGDLHVSLQGYKVLSGSGR